MSVRGIRFLEQSGHFYGPNDFTVIGYRDRQRRARQQQKAYEEQQAENALNRIKNMSESERVVVATAQAVRDRMAQRHQSWSDAGIIGKWVMGRKETGLSLEHGINASGSRLTLGVRLADHAGTDWLLLLTSPPSTKKGHSTRLAFANYSASDLTLYETQPQTARLEAVDAPQFQIKFGLPRIQELHSQTESPESLWPTPERTEQLRGVLELVLPQL